MSADDNNAVDRRGTKPVLPNSTIMGMPRPKDKRTVKAETIEKNANGFSSFTK
jgi:hypothetical protein